MKGKNKKSEVDQKDLRQALIKKALGFDATEVVEEYVQKDDGDVLMTKRKVTKKSVPPDMTALKILIETQEQKPLSNLTDEELEGEKQRLLELLSQLQQDKEN